MLIKRLINYLPENGVGDITNVFPKSKEIGELLNIKSIMLYIFNKENVQKITKMKEENEKLQAEIKELRLTNDGSAFSEKIIRENMSKLSFESTDSIQEMKDKFLQYKKTLQSDNKSVKNKDLLYLVKASQILAEEIKYQMFLQKQAKYESDNIKKSNKLLEMLNTILSKNDSNREIINILKKDIQDNDKDISLLNIKDYETSLHNLKAKKEEIDKQINIINTGLDKFTYDEKIKIVNILDNAFQNYNENNIDRQIEQKSEKIQANNKEINMLNNMVDANTLKRFNDLLTNTYKLFNEIQLVKNDFSKDNFKLIFNPAKVSVYAVITEKDKEGNNKEKIYMPGSKARMTLWQLSTYLTMAKFIKNNFKGMPFAEYLCIDAVIQEFVDDKLPTNVVINCVKNFALKNEIQIIMSGALNTQNLNINQNELVNIDQGLNPWFNY